MKILLIGADGQVGKELRASLSLLESEQSRVVCFTRKDLDLVNLFEIREVLKWEMPGVIVNAAAYTAVDRAESEPDMANAINHDAVKELANYCKWSGARLIHISTDYVFDGLFDQPYTETNAVGPTGVYGRSKLAGEEAIRGSMCSYFILRTSWVFGFSGSNFVKTMLKLADHNTQLAIVADQFGAPTSAKAIANVIVEVVRQILSAPQSTKWCGTYHFSGRPFASWAEFADEIFEQAITKGLIPATPRVNPIATSEYPTTARRPANSRLDCSKLKNVFDIEPDNWKRSLGLVLDDLKEGIHS